MSAKRPRTYQGVVNSDLDNPSNPVRGCLPLPVELVLQIISNIPRPYNASYEIDPMLEDSMVSYWEHQDVLSALSQTSRLLRNICLPLLWEHLVVCTDGKGAQECHRMTTGLSQNPALAAYVRIVDLDEIDNLPLLAKLTTCLSSLPNMYTLRILNCFPYLEYDIAQPVFPQVRTLILPASIARQVVPCCPRVRTIVSCSRIKGWSDFVGLFDGPLETLLDLHGFLLSPETIKYIVEIAQKSQVSRLDSPRTPHTL